MLQCTIVSKELMERMVTLLSDCVVSCCADELTTIISPHSLLLHVVEIL